jgi:hypothetical protein
MATDFWVSTLKRLVYYTAFVALRGRGAESIIGWTYQRAKVWKYVYCA